ncbi:MAG: hypothetical protein LBV49_02340 [Azonexus sp.]|jgi:tetratricopeptide (TPR) repeat protein|nr:hypothetical protein [Azonexus sp.]
MIDVQLADDWRINPPPEPFANFSPQGWVLSLPEEDAARRLLGELAKTPNARLLSRLGMILAVLALLLPLSLFAVLGNGIYDLLVGEPSLRLMLVSGGALLAYIVLAIIAAGSQRLSLLSQELGAMVDNFRDMTSRFHLRPARIKRLTRAWCRHHGLWQTRRVAIWNPGPPRENTVQVFWDILLPLFEEMLPDGSELTLHVRADEMPTVRAALRQHARLRLRESVSRSTVGAALTPGSALAAAERALLCIMRIAAFPRDRIVASPLAEAVGPCCFSENAFARLTRSFASDAEQEAAPRFLARCRSDYGYLDMDAGQIEILRLPEPLATETWADASDLAARMRQSLLSDPRRFLHEGDPAALLCTLNALAVLHDASEDAPLRQNLKRQLKALIGETLLCLEERENYPLFTHIARQEFTAGPNGVQPGGQPGGQLARLLPRVIGEDDAASALGREVLDLTRFNAFDAATLLCLARLLEICGFYPAASAVWLKLKNIDPLRAGIHLARLCERQGRAAEGLAGIGRLLADNRLDQRPEIRVAALLEGAWLCYSATPEALDQGWLWLDAADDELERQPGEAQSHWRLHNYRALYFDAAGRYAEAIAEHRLALSIPGVRLKWYSGSLSNLAYVSRKAALAAPGEVGQRLGAALEYAELAVKLKRRIADKDELPVALHNLALTHLCRALTDKAATATAAASARAACAEGLAILDEIESDKKRFALCLEMALAVGLSGEDWATPLATACAAWPSEREQVVLARMTPDETGLAALGKAILALEILD